MSSRKYLKNTLNFDLIYRSKSTNPLDLPFVKKSSFFCSDISVLSKTLTRLNILKLLSHTNPKVCLALRSTNELSVRKGDPLFCRLALGQYATTNFIASCSAALPSNSFISPFFVDLKKRVVSFSFENLDSFFSINFYQSSISLGSHLNKNFSFSLYFSKPLGSGSVSLFSVFYPFFGLKKKINNFRTILREMEQSG